MLFRSVGLGVWQVERLHWKEALIASVETGMRAPPVPLAEALSRDLDGEEYHHVVIAGRFLHDKESYLFAQGPKGAIGVQVITPLVEENGETVLVNRGFVPEALHDPKTREAGQVTGTVALTGVLRLSQEPGLFTPAPELAKRLWFVKNVPAMAKAADVSVTAPIMIEADADRKSTRLNSSH